MSRRSQRPAPAPAAPRPATFDEIAKLPKAERIALLESELASTDTQLDRLAHHRSEVLGALKMARATD